MVVERRGRHLDPDPSLGRRGYPEHVAPQSVEGRLGKSLGGPDGSMYPCSRFKRVDPQPTDLLASGCRKRKVQPEGEWLGDAVVCYEVTVHEHLDLGRRGRTSSDIEDLEDCCFVRHKTVIRPAADGTMVSIMLRLVYEETIFGEQLRQTLAVPVVDRFDESPARERERSKIHDKR